VKFIILFYSPFTISFACFAVASKVFTSIWIDSLSFFTSSTLSAKGSDKAPAVIVSTVRGVRVYFSFLMSVMII